MFFKEEIIKAEIKNLNTDYKFIESLFKKNKTKNKINNKKNKLIYEITKNMSIVYTKLLTDKDDWKGFLDKYKKQDDLCDSFLQGYYYMGLN